MNAEDSISTGRQIYFNPNKCIPHVFNRMAKRQLKNEKASLCLEILTCQK